MASSPRAAAVNFMHAKDFHVSAADSGLDIRAAMLRGMEAYGIRLVELEINENAN